MREGQRVGTPYLADVTTLLQRVRSSHPTAGVFEAADFQWWWRKPRPTDHLPQLFWFDDDGLPEAAVIATDWGGSIGLAPIVMPEAEPEWLAHVVERGLAHATEAGLTPLEVVIDRADAVMIEILATQGFTDMRDEAVEAWLTAEDRPDTSPLALEYRLASRLETRPAQHHMAPRNGPAVEKRLRQASLYRPDLDLVVLDESGGTAAYGLFWLDVATGTGLVEPMRTEDDHQRRGLARHVLTTGINRLVDGGARRIKIVYFPDNQAAARLYTSVGFRAIKQGAVVSRPA